MKPKFQPMPSRTSDQKNWNSSTPVIATPPAQASRNRPSATIRMAPKRAIRCPVTKEGAYIAITWAETMSAALPVENPQPTTAKGVEVIIRFISA